MQKIEFLGAAGDEVTGSSYLLTADDGNQVLVDFGMFQGSQELEDKNYSPLLFHPPALQGVFVTHAHLDHSGRLPLLVFGGFLGKIYMTAPTKALIEIILQDSARIAEKDLTRHPLYTADEVWKTLNMIQVVEYNKEVSVGSFKATFKDAGHILGSSSIELVDTSSNKKQKIVLSGDLGNTPQDIVMPTEYIQSSDFVVMESTYGDSSHPQEDAKQIIQEEINTIEKTHGVLLIPAFAIQRTQEVLHIIHHLKKAGKILPGTPIYLDSPMGIDVTAVYLDFLRFCNNEIQAYKDVPFSFEGLVVINDSQDSKNIVDQPAPKVIIAGSGMMSGGRILHHAINYLDRETTRVLFVGYQSEETLGRKILEGAKNVKIDERNIPVRAHIREIKILSSHADQPKLLKWLSSMQGVKKVFLTHGEKQQREVLAEKIKNELKIPSIVLPKNEQVYTFT